MHVTKRGKVWQYRFYVTTSKGKRTTVSKSGFRTKHDCLVAGAKEFNEYNINGSVFADTSITFEELVKDFLEYVKENKKILTHINYTQNMERNILPFIGKLKLRDINTLTINRLLIALKQKGFSEGTIKNIKVLLSSTFNYAIRYQHLITVNPCKDAIIPKVAKKTRDRAIISDEDWKLITDKYKPGTSEYIFLCLGYYAGLRNAEARGLTWDRVNFDEHTLTIDRQIIYTTDDGNFLSTTKNGLKRKVVMCKILEDALREEKRRQEEDKVKRGRFYPTSKLGDFVCVNEHRPFLSHNYSVILTNSLRDYGVDFCYHELRHTYVSNLIKAGVNIKVAQDQAGHKSIQTTLQIYSHITDDMRHSEIQKLEDVFNK